MTAPAIELEPDYQTKRGSGSGVDTVYGVEARYAYPEPRIICGQVFDNRWRQVYFKEAAGGVPINNSQQCPRAALDGLYNYEAAQALRWWFHAQAAADTFGSSICLETRLVEHKIKYTYETVAVSQHCLVSGEDRSNIMPDWNQPRPERIKE